MAPSKFEHLLTCTSLDFLDVFFSSWPLDSIIYLSASSFRVNSAIRSYKRVIWDPDLFFARWFSRPLSFRQVLGECGAIVSGSQALQFFDRTVYDDSDMDIFMKLDRFDMMHRWLSSGGYKLSGLRDHYHMEWKLSLLRDAEEIGRKPQSVLRAVFSYTRQDSGPFGVTRSRVVQIIIVDVDPVEFMLSDFHTTAVMNFISSEVAICAFPRSTLISHSSYLCKYHYEDNDVKIAGWYQKYVARGFRMLCRDSRGDFEDVVLGRRRLDDDKSLTLEFRKFSGHLRRSRRTNIRFSVSRAGWSEEKLGPALAIELIE